MKILLQWATRDAADWLQLDSRQWAALATRPEPSPQQLGATDNQPGWVNDLCIQGVSLGGADHLAVEDILIGGESGTRITTWNDDPIDWPVGTRSAQIWTILPLAPDIALGGAINTRQNKVIYAEGQGYIDLVAGLAQNTIVLPWAAFILPSDEITRHGVWLPDAKFAELKARQTLWDWRHWVDHLPDNEVMIDALGRRALRTQRDLGRWLKAKGTITYYQRDTARATGAHITTFEDALELTTAVAVTQTKTVPGNSSQIHWAFTTPADEPHSAAWPSGTYRCQFDCTAAGADLTYGLLSLAGHFGRVDSGLTADLETTQQAEAAFSGTGLKLATKSWTPAAGAAGDRFDLVVKVPNANSHTAEDITLRLNTADSFADGPWPTRLPPGLDGSMAEWYERVTAMTAVMDRF